MQNDPSPAEDPYKRAHQLLAWREALVPRCGIRKKRRPDGAPQKVGYWIQGRYPQQYAKILKIIEEEERAERSRKPAA
ncbi:hypothetical protein [Hydrogenophaga sp.]|uniref:hypothetical protein n=1 Tax=Hydrogenophaga sp. TaxID=1904254 RepID=UPI0025C5801F|nr:hypothetical protein [Hydrogenophaga sp.]